jgi:DNA repair protein RecO (recombination protein O)
MASYTSEAVLLRTWPVQEADLVVSLFTRDYGHIRLVAKSALKSRKRFGGALEPMTLARAFFVERPRQELGRLDQLEIISSPLSAPIDPLRLSVLSFYAELLDEALPDHDPQETVFRLVATVLEQTTVQQPWMPLTYFQLWMTRLMGLLPDLVHCTACGEALHAADEALRAADEKQHAAKELRGADRQSTSAFFNPHSDGLFCSIHRGADASTLSADSWLLAQRMLRAPVSVFVGEPFPRRRAQDLRRFTLQSLERHLERRLRSAEALARLGG